MNIFLTGGAGFIGSRFAERVLSEGHDLFNIDNFDQFYDRRLKEQNLERLLSFKQFRSVEGDIRNKGIISQIFEENKFDLVVHLAAKAGVRPSLRIPEEYFDVNVNGTLNILENMKTHKINKLIVASSSSVYGNNKKVPFSETDNVDNPISPYAASKKALELICSTYHNLYNIDIFAFRYFTVYGPSQRPEMAIASFTNAILNNKPITLFDAKGNTSRDYTFIDDIIDGMLNSINKVNGFEIFNLGNSSTVSLNQLVKVIEDCLGKKAQIIFAEKQPGDVQTTYAEISKAKKLLEYNPK